MKHIYQTLLIFLVALLVAGATTVHAAEKESAAAGKLRYQTEDVTLFDERAQKLQAYLSTFDSPLVASASHFVREADRLDLDWRFVAAIAGAESTYGRHIPQGSHNAWGWGIPTGASHGIGFSSWNEGITEVSEGLRNNYINQGAETIEQIGSIYAASPRWSGNVRFFMTDIDDFEITDPSHVQLTL